MAAPCACTQKRSRWLPACALLLVVGLQCAAATSGGVMLDSPLVSIKLPEFIPPKNCKAARPTLFLMSGVGGTQMRGFFNKAEARPEDALWTAGCPAFNQTEVVWFADQWALNAHLRCWGYLMSLQYHPPAEGERFGRWTNSSGSAIFPDWGNNLGEFPEGAKQKAYYAFLMKHLLVNHGYMPGVDFFLLPFDWRTGIQGLEQNGDLDRLTQKIAAGVANNCGQKAIVISHSYGANVMGTILQKPEYKQWREDNMRGWVPVGAPFGGCAATAWLSVLNGDFFKLFPILSNLVPIKWMSSLRPTVVAKSVYKFAFGLPSWTFMMPRPIAFAESHVVVSTPTKNYTVVEQQQLLKDMGDVGGASIIDDSWARTEAMLQYGPIPGIETYCLYGTSVPTPVTLVYNESVPQHAPMARPYKVETADGDGVVDLPSLRLCNRLAPADHVVEVNGPLIDHSTILSHPVSLRKLSGILKQMGVPTVGPLGRIRAGFQRLAGSS